MLILFDHIFPRLTQCHFDQDAAARVDRKLQNNEYATALKLTDRIEGCKARDAAIERVFDVCINQGQFHVAKVAASKLETYHDKLQQVFSKEIGAADFASAVVTCALISDKAKQKEALKQLTQTMSDAKLGAEKLKDIESAVRMSFAGFSQLQIFLLETIMGLFKRLGETSHVERINASIQALKHPRTFTTIMKGLMSKAYTAGVTAYAINAFAGPQIAEYGAKFMEHAQTLATAARPIFDQYKEQAIKLFI